MDRCRHQEACLYLSKQNIQRYTDGKTFSVVSYKRNSLNAQDGIHVFTKVFLGVLYFPHAHTWNGEVIDCFDREIQISSGGACVFA